MRRRRQRISMAEAKALAEEQERKALRAKEDGLCVKCQESPSLPDENYCEECRPSFENCMECHQRSVVNSIYGQSGFCEYHALREAREVAENLIVRKQMVEMAEAWFDAPTRRVKGGEYRQQKEWAEREEDWLRDVVDEIGALFDEEYEEVPEWMR